MNPSPRTEAPRTESPLELSITQIACSVGSLLDVTSDELVGPDKRHRIALARSICMYLLRRNTRMSLPAIGAAFNRKHCTVIHALRALESKMRRDESVAAEVNYLQQRVDGMDAKARV